jgi:very-short-patch-repair endonuclease
MHIHNRKELMPRRKELRNGATEAERHLWRFLKGGHLQGRKFRRQHSIGWYIADFYCPSERLVIELDGDSHYTDEAQEYDAQRTLYLNRLGITILRYTNHQVRSETQSVLEDICKHFETI